MATYKCFKWKCEPLKVKLHIFKVFNINNILIFNLYIIEFRIATLICAILAICDWSQYLSPTICTTYAIRHCLVYKFIAFKDSVGSSQYLFIFSISYFQIWFWRMSHIISNAKTVTVEVNSQNYCICKDSLSFSKCITFYKCTSDDYEALEKVFFNFHYF